MNKNTMAGLTMIELLISLVISSFVALTVLSVFSMQGSMAVKQSGRSVAVEDGRETFTVTSNLIKQAEAASIIYTSTASSATISFTILPDVPIWPNTTAPYTDNAIKLSWTNQGTYANQITIAKAADIAGLAGATPVVLAGDASGRNTKITGMSLTDQGNGSYLYSLAVESGSYYGGNPQKTSFEGVILPRN